MSVTALRDRMCGVLGFPITPFRPDLSLNLDALAENVAEMVRYPFCALVAAGGVGEVYSLAPREIEDGAGHSGGDRGPDASVGGTAFNGPLGGEIDGGVEKAGLLVLLFDVSEVTGSC